MQDTISDFLEGMKAFGIVPDEPCEILPDDEWHSLRAAGDKPGKKVIYYRLKIDGDFAVGNFGSHREGVTHTWTTKATRKMDDAEREALKERIAEEKKRKDKERSEAQEKAAQDAKAMLDNADLQIDLHPYLMRKGVRLDDLPIDGDNLLVPMRDVTGKLWGVQTITPDGDKLYMRGARKDGCFYPLAGSDKRVYIICEGVATGASIKQAIPEHTVLCAFDAGNISKVAKAVRDSLPDVRIVIACDNDAYTTNQKGEPYNTGIEKGQQAAALVKGFAIWPEFVDNDETKYTDFNDLHLSAGLEAVRDRILPVLGAQEVVPAEVSFEASALVGVQASAGDDTGMEKGDMGLPFRVLGYNNGKYYYFPFALRQIVEMGHSSHSLSGLMQLASLNEWQIALSGAHSSLTPSQISPMATNALFRMAEKRGVFAEEDRVRGCGAWLDAGRRVLHCGDVLFVDGEQIDPKDIKSEYVYIAAPRMLRPAKTSLTSREAIKLRYICEMPTWETKLSGSLLAGWLVVAPVCSMLPWRPHIWITGEAEAGKSSILDKIIKPILGAIALNVDGGTSEAAIRSMMGYDGRPMIYDEAESENQNQKTIMEGVLALARKASSGGQVAKYGQRMFKVRFCACFAAINPGVTAFADESRISMLSLKKNRKPTAQQDYNELLNAIAETITSDFRAGLLARVVEHMPTLLKNIEVFRTAARTVLNAARVADQIAPMLAGLYLLGSTKVIGLEDAEKWVKEQDWSMNTAVNQELDCARLIRYISTCLIRTDIRKGIVSDVSFGEMIHAMVYPNEEINKEYANRVLRKYSIAVIDGYVCIGYKDQNLAKLLRGTQWEINWHRSLLDTPGASAVTSQYFAPGNKQRAVKIPINLFVGDDDD